MNRPDEFNGNWFVDDIISFEFDGKRNGILKVPTDEYLFQDNKLNLRGIDETTGTYSFVKQKQL